jgi:sugar/nucleoside kinase (ribokinase family)
MISALGGLNFDIVYETERFSVLEESVNAKSLADIPGGKGLHTAVAANSESQAIPYQLMVVIRDLTTPK